MPADAAYRRVATPYGRAGLYRPEAADRAAAPPGAAPPVVVAPGFSETLAHTHALVDALARQRFRACSYDQPRRDASAEPLARQAEILLRVMDAAFPGDQRVHAAAHSMGAAAVLKAAVDAPQRFAGVVLAQPIGLSGVQGLGELSIRIVRKVVHNQRTALRGQGPTRQPPSAGYAAAVDVEGALAFSRRVARAQTAGGGVLLRNLPLALREAKAAGAYDLADDAAAVSRLGIPVHVVAAHADELFDAARLDAGCRRVRACLASYSSVADPRAGHDSFWLQPTRSAAVIAQLLRPGRVS